MAGTNRPGPGGFLLDEAPDALERLLVLQPAVPQLPAELNERSARTCERAYSLANRYPPGSSARRGLIGLDPPEPASPNGSTLATSVPREHVAPCGSWACLLLGAVGPGPLRDHRPDGTPLARRAHPRRAVARATAILAAHAPLLTQFVALAVQAVSAQLDRAAASALQRSLVPSALPAVGGLEMAARYVPGTGHLGGGWYDVFCLPPGQGKRRHRRRGRRRPAGSSDHGPYPQRAAGYALETPPSRLPSRHRAGLSRTSAHVR